MSDSRRNTASSRGPVPWLRAVTVMSVLLSISPFSTRLAIGASGDAADTSAPTDAAPPDRSADKNFDDALRSFRDFSALSGDVLVGMLPAASRAAVTRTLGLDIDGARWVWSLFFKGAVWIPATDSGGRATAAYYNPAFDVALLSQWRKVGSVWSLVSLEPRTGAALRHEPVAMAPAWVVTRSSPIAAGFLAQGLPRVDQIEEAPAVGSRQDALLPLARMWAMRREAARLAHAHASLIETILPLIETGNSAQLRHAGAGKADAHAMTKLPAVFRRGLVVFGAVPDARGDVLVLGPERGPGLVYLIAVEKSGAISAITAVAELDKRPLTETPSSRGAS